MVLLTEHRELTRCITLMGKFINSFTFDSSKVSLWDDLQPSGTSYCRWNFDSMHSSFDPRIPMISPCWNYKVDNGFPKLFSALHTRPARVTILLKYTGIFKSEVVCGMR
jgi:hypothetical protein